MKKHSNKKTTSKKSGIKGQPAVVVTGPTDTDKKIRDMEFSRAGVDSVTEQLANNYLFGFVPDTIVGKIDKSDVTNDFSKKERK